MSDDRVFHSICPFCGSHLDRVGHIVGDNLQPDNGDVTLCIRCGEVGVFDDTVLGGVREPTSRERRNIRRDPDVAKVREAWLASVGIMKRRQ